MLISTIKMKYFHYVCVCLGVWTEMHVYQISAISEQNLDPSRVRFESSKASGSKSISTRSIIFTCLSSESKCLYISIIKRKWFSSLRVKRIVNKTEFNIYIRIRDEKTNRTWKQFTKKCKQWLCNGYCGHCIDICS